LVTILVTQNLILLLFAPRSQLRAACRARFSLRSMSYGSTGGWGLIEVRFA
jgi:hypothetical protein